MDGADASQGRAVRRSEGRLRVRLPAFAIMHAGTERVILCDVSQGGAKIFSRSDLPLERDFVLRWGDYEGLGKLVWRRDGLHGVQFAEPLEAGALAGTREQQDRGGMGRDDMNGWLAKTEWAFGKALN